MPITYSIDPKLGVIFTTAWDVLTVEELFEHKRKLAADPDFKPGMVELSDVRQITELDVTPEGIGRFVAQDTISAEKLRDYKLAIIVSQEVVFGMARMYEMMTEQNVSNVAVFRDLEEAKTWLGRW